jgi:hypothetical protein
MQIINPESTGPICRAVEGCQMRAQHGAVDEAIDASYEVIAGDRILEPECVEQALPHHETLAH